MQVCRDTISGAGRANSNVTATISNTAFASKCVIGITIVLSIYSIITAQDWQTDLEKQIISWSGAIAGGKLGAEIGALVGRPIVALLASIAGSLFGGLQTESLALQFLGHPYML